VQCSTPLLRQNASATARFASWSRPTRRAAVKGGVELKESVMYNIVWLVGAVVIVLFVLGYVGLR
jgi:hypothetical protein